jgi:hypothetical protein
MPETNDGEGGSYSPEKGMAVRRTRIMLNRIFSSFSFLAIAIACLGLFGLAALAIAFLTVSFQAIRAARSNPVDSLKYE